MLYIELDTVLLGILALAALIYLVNNWRLLCQVFVLGSSLCGAAFIALVATGYLVLDPKSPQLVHWWSDYRPSKFRVFVHKLDGRPTFD